MFPLYCAKCHSELFAPGALLFSPPLDAEGSVQKLHICVQCWLMTLNAMGIPTPILTY